MNRGKVEYLSNIFECEFCGLCYATESDLRIHQEGEHDGEFSPRIVSVTGNYKPSGDSPVEEEFYQEEWTESGEGLEYEDGTNFVDDSLHLGYISPEEIIYQPAVNNGIKKTNGQPGGGKQSGPQNFHNYSSISKVYPRDQAPEKPLTFECPECKKCFKKKRYLDNHIRTHTGEKPYKCPHCSKGFHQYGSYYSHQKRCPERFSSVLPAAQPDKEEGHRIRLNSSVSISFVKEATQMDDKTEKAVVDDGAGKTVADHQPEKTVADYQLKKALAGCQPSKTVVHNQAEETVGPKESAVDKVGNNQKEITPVTKNVNEKGAMTTNVKEGLQCRFCSKVFQLRIQVIVHERTHTGEHSHPCQYCNMRFSQLSSRDRHQEVCPQRKIPENEVSKDSEDSEEYFVCPINIVKLIDLTDGAEEDEEMEQGGLDANAEPDDFDANDEPDENGVEDVDDEEEEYACNFCNTQFITPTSLAIHEAMCAKDKRGSQSQSSSVEPQQTNVQPRPILPQVELPSTAFSATDWSQMTPQVDRPTTVTVIRRVGTPGIERGTTQVTQPALVEDAIANEAVPQAYHHQKAVEDLLAPLVERPPSVTVIKQTSFAAQQENRGQVTQPTGVVNMTDEEVVPQAETHQQNSEPLQTPQVEKPTTATKEVDPPSAERSTEQITQPGGVVVATVDEAEPESDEDEENGEDREKDGEAVRMTRSFVAEQNYYRTNEYPDSDSSRELSPPVLQREYYNVPTGGQGGNHYGSQQFPCRFCEKSWRYPSERERHEKRHLGQRDFQCGKCGKAFCERYSLVRHTCKTVEDTLQTTVQEISSMRSPSRAGLRQKNNLRDNNDNIQRVQSNGSQRNKEEHQFSCTYCRKEFPQKFLCNLHMMECRRRSISSKSTPSPYSFTDSNYPSGASSPAPEINAYSKRPSSSLKRQSNSKTGSHSVRASNKSSEQRVNPLVLSRVGPAGHFRLERGKKSCPVCHKKFAHGHSLRVHLNVHSDARPFRCKRCGIGYNNPGTLTRHRRRCTGACQKKFPPSAPTYPESSRANQSNVPSRPVARATTSKTKNVAPQQQVRKPTSVCEPVRYLPQLTRIVSDGNKVAHSCNFCGKTSKSKSDMERHTKVHLGLNIFQCPYCPNRFPTRDEIIWHVRNHPEAAENLEDKDARDDLSYAERYPEVFKYIHESLSGKTRVLSCTLCGKSWSSKDAAYRARDHMPKHTGVAEHKCKHCEKSFVRPYLLRQHMASEHPEETSTSPETSFESPSTEPGAGIMLRKRKFFCCERCNGSFSHSDALEAHKKTCRATKLKPIRADVPDKQRSPKEGDRKLQLTEKVPSSEDTVRFDSTPVRYVPNITRHITQNRRTSYSCNICSKTVFNVTDATRHTRKHVGDNTYYCPHCDERFPEKREVVQHVATAHPNAEGNVSDLIRNPMARYRDLYKNITDRIVDGQPVFTCKICQTERSKWYLMREHFVSSHMTRQFTCEQCGEDFKSAKSLREHEETHSHTSRSSSARPGSSMLRLNERDGQEEPMSTTVAPKTETKPSQNGTEEHKHRPYEDSLLKMTAASDSEERRKTRKVVNPDRKPRSQSELDIHFTEGDLKGYPVFTCNICKKMFTTRYRARRHIIGRHAIDKPFKCNYCEKSYLHSTGLEEHLLQHKTEKPYECPKCPIRFTSKDLMSSHLLGHFKRTPLLCFTCGEWFMFKYQFDRHALRVHEEESSRPSFV